MKQNNIVLMISLSLLTGIYCSSANATTFINCPTTAPVTPPTGDIFDVKLYGAKGDGITDDTCAIQKTVDAIYSARKIFVSPAGRTLMRGPELLFSGGNYLISDTINFPMGTINIQSDGAAIIHLQAGKSLPLFVFGGESASTGSQKVKIQGLQFVSGTNQIVFSNANMNGSLLKIEDCEFRESTDYAIKTVGVITSISPDLHMSANITIDNSRFFDVGGVLDNYCDEAVIRDSWVQVGLPNLANTLSVFLNHHGTLMLETMMGIPATAVAGAFWVKMLGGNLFANRSRFGGEGGGGYPIVSFDWDGTEGANVYFMGPSIVIENSALCAGPTKRADSGVIFLHSGVPYSIRLVGNNYLTGSPYINVSPDLDVLAFIANASKGTKGYVRDPKTIFKFTMGPNMAYPTSSIPTTLTDYIQ